MNVHKEYIQNNSFKATDVVSVSIFGTNYKWMLCRIKIQKSKSNYLAENPKTNKLKHLAFKWCPSLVSKVILRS